MCGGDGERRQTFRGGRYGERVACNARGDVGNIHAVCRVGVAGEIVAKVDGIGFAFHQVGEVGAGHPVEVFFQVGVIVGVVTVQLVVPLLAPVALT